MVSKDSELATKLHSARRSVRFQPGLRYLACGQDSSRHLQRRPLSLEPVPQAALHMGRDWTRLP